MTEIALLIAVLATQDLGPWQYLVIGAIVLDIIFVIRSVRSS